MKVAVCHPGTQHAGKLAALLQSRGLLGRFVTGLRPRPGSWIARRLRLSGLRSLDPALADFTTQIRTPEVFGKIAQSLGWKGESLMRFRNAWFQRSIPARVLDANDAVVGFDTSSWILARRVQECGKPFILDRAAVHRPTRARLREQFGALGFGAGESREGGEAQDAIEREEIERASRVVVASRFSRDSLLNDGVAAQKIGTIPYGVDWDFFSAPVGRREESQRVIFLFVGLLKAEKGVGVLLDAWKQLGCADAELRIVGAGDDALAARARSMAGVTLHGKLGLEDLRRAYAAASVFVFPTLCDGFGMVLLEAMASGLPIIATTNSGGPELVERSGAGSIVPPGDATALAAAMQEVCAAPAEWRARGRAAMETAREFTWETYGERWSELLGEVVR